MARTSGNRQGPQGASRGGEAAGGRPGREDGRPGRESGRLPRVLALIAVAIGLAGLTVAACVLSYSSIHHLAIQAGVHGRLASIYPLIFDALLVVAGCSVLALRGAGLVSRTYSWLCMLVLLAALAAGGVARAAAMTIPHKTAAVVAAIVPWALVLIGFGLLLALLRYARLRRLGRRDGGQDGGAGGNAAADEAGADDATEPEPPAGASAPVIAGAAAAGPAADASSGGPGVEPPTAPGSAIPPQRASDAVDRLADQPAAASPAAGPRPDVRRADLQLRARIAQRPAQDATGARGATPGWQEPFMPKVGQHGADTGQSPAGQQERPGPPAQGAAGQPVPKATAEDATTTALPKRAPGRQPVTGGFRPASAAPTNPRSPADQASGRAGAAGAEPAEAEAAQVEAAQVEAAQVEAAQGAWAAEPAAGQSARPGPPGTLNPAPTRDSDAGDTDGLPAFRRTRSTPTPPQGDEPQQGEPQQG